MPELGQDLDQYAAAGLIESWRDVPGRGAVVVALSGEYELRTPREVTLFCGALASALQAIHIGRTEER